MTGQLYTTHLLSLEALLTVIDSTEAHCQAKVLSSTAQQDQSETVLAEGEGSAKNGTNSTPGISTFYYLTLHFNIVTSKNASVLVISYYVFFSPLSFCIYCLYLFIILIIIYSALFFFK